MSLFDIPKLYLYAGAAIVVAGLLATSHYKMYTAGERSTQTRWDADNYRKTQDLIAANQEARRIETSRQTKVIEAQNAAQTRAKNLQTVVRATAVERDGLRNDLAAISANLPGLTADACSRYAATANAVLTELGAEAESLARAADQHHADSIMLQEAWPTDKVPQ